MSQMTDQLLIVAAAYCEATKLSLARVSTLVFNHGSKLALLRDGADVSTATHERAMLWFSTHWPERTRWPKGVVRPSPEPAKASA